MAAGGIRDAELEQGLNVRKVLHEIGQAWQKKDKGYSWKRLQPCTCRERSQRDFARLYPVRGKVPVDAKFLSILGGGGSPKKA